MLRFITEQLQRSTNANVNSIDHCSPTLSQLRWLWSCSYWAANSDIIQRESPDENIAETVSRTWQSQFLTMNALGLYLSDSGLDNVFFYVTCFTYEGCWNSFQTGATVVQQERLEWLKFAPELLSALVYDGITFENDWTLSAIALPILKTLRQLTCSSFHVCSFQRYALCL